MGKQYKSEKVRLAFEEFANKNKGVSGLRAKDINSSVAEMLGGSLGGWCVSDFAYPETSKPRSKHNKRLFQRENRRGYYTVL